MQDNLYTFYQERIGTLTDELTGLKKRIHLIGSLRLAIVVAAGLLSIFLNGQQRIGFHLLIIRFTFHRINDLS